MYIVVTGNNSIRAAYNDTPPATSVLSGDTVVEVSGDAETYDFGHRGASSCGWNGSSITSYVAAVREEAERRINAGTVINGVQFRCDDHSTNRIHGMWQEAELIEAANGSYSATFLTDGGDKVTVEGAEQAKAIFLAAVGFVRMILGKSATLQAMGNTESGIPSDFTNDSYWTE